jgi:hypothetical protein
VRQEFTGKLASVTHIVLQGMDDKDLEQDSQILDRVTFWWYRQNCGFIYAGHLSTIIFSNTVGMAAITNVASRSLAEQRFSSQLKDVKSTFIPAYTKLLRQKGMLDATAQRSRLVFPVEMSFLFFFFFSFADQFFL